MSRSNDGAFDVAIVGGGPAGLAAALILGRMRRSVVLLDADDPAHARATGCTGSSLTTAPHRSSCAESQGSSFGL